MTSSPPDDNDKDTNYLDGLNLSTRVKLLRSLSLIGFTTTSIFGINSLLHGRHSLGAVLLLISFIGVLSNLIFHKEKDYQKAISVIATGTIALGCFLVFTGSVDGTGLYWTAPILVIIIFSTPFAVGASLSCTYIVFVSTSLILDAPWVTYDYPAAHIIRFISASTILTAICLVREYSHISSLSKMDSLRADLSTAANTDSLTKLFNRRYITENFLYHDKFKPEIQKGSSVLLADIDHFKKINDHYGHDAGDQVLKMVADALRDTTRSNDILARWGGEEFLIILPGIPQEVAIKRGQQFIDRIAQEVLYLDIGILKVTMSIGVSHTSTEKLASEVLKEADENLYLAKEGGRNQVCY